MAAATPPAPPAGADAACQYQEHRMLGVPEGTSTGSAPLQFRDQPLLTAKTLVFVGEAEHLRLAGVPPAPTVVSAFMTTHAVVSQDLLPGLKAADDDYSLQETRVAHEGTVTRVVLLVLPGVAGRHNCAARPHAIRKGLAAAGLCGAVEVVLVLPDASRAHAAALAVPRAIPAYTRKTKRGGGVSVSVSFDLLDGAVVGAPALARMARLSSSIRMVGALMDQPASELHTPELTALARTVAHEAGGTIAILSGTELRDAGYGGLWGVGKAGAHPPALAILSYVPQGVSPEAPSICLVGKGIVYDTGGLTIKTGGYMNGMKMDMGGAAGILGAWRALALGAGTPDLELTHPVHALLCLAENSVGEDAVRPDDILTMFSGLTVELNNTDAEGRLVLGDGVAHAVKFLNPAIIFDMATLTGAQSMATGDNHAALYCNQEALEATVVAAGKVTGDLAHPLPYAPEFYRKEFASPIADMKNSVANRWNAQASCAGQFVGNHLGAFQTEGSWCHIDMAAPAKAAARGTGYGVALLEEVVTALSGKGAGAASASAGGAQ